MSDDRSPLVQRLEAHESIWEGLARRELGQVIDEWVRWGSPQVGPDPEFRALIEKYADGHSRDLDVNELSALDWAWQERSIRIAKLFECWGTAMGVADGLKIARSQS